MGADGLQKSSMGKYMHLFRLFPAVGFLVMMNMKSVSVLIHVILFIQGVVLYFLVSTLFTLALTKLCKVESFRKKYNFPPAAPVSVDGSKSSSSASKPLELSGYNNQRFVGNLKSHGEINKSKTNNSVKKL